MNEEYEEPRNIYPRVIEVMNSIYHHNDHQHESGTSTSKIDDLAYLEKKDHGITDIKRIESELQIQSDILRKLSLELGFEFEFNSTSDGLVKNVKTIQNNVKQVLENLHSSQQALDKKINILFANGQKVLSQFEQLKRNVYSLEWAVRKEKTQIKQIQEVLVNNEDGADINTEEINDDYEDKPLETLEKINFTKDKFSRGSSQRATSYTWKIQIGDGNEAKTHLSPIFVIYGYSIDAEAKIRFQPPYIIISLCLINSVNTKDSLSISLPYPTISYKLLDLSDHKMKTDIHRMADIPSVNRLQNKDFSYEVTLWAETDFKKRYINVDDVGDACMSVEIVVDWPDTRYQPFSFNGILMWEVKHYAHKRKQQCKITDCHYSPYFYTIENGYRVKSGLKIVDGISVVVQFVSGKFDKFLSKTPTFSITVTLIDDNSAASNITKSAMIHDLRSITFGLIQQSESHKIKNFVKDDTLLIKVVVEQVYITHQNIC